MNRELTCLNCGQPLKRNLLQGNVANGKAEFRCRHCKTYMTIRFTDDKEEALYKKKLTAVCSIFWLVITLTAANSAVINLHGLSIIISLATIAAAVLLIKQSRDLLSTSQDLYDRGILVPELKNK